MEKFIKGLPKAELHVHLEGTLEPDLKLKLAQKNGIDIGQKTVEEVKKSYQFDSLTSFLNVYYPAMQVLQEEEDFYALAEAYLLKAKEHNVKYVEMFFDPQAHTSRGVAIEKVIHGYHRAAKDAKKLGIEAKLIMCFLRDMSLASAQATYAAALPYRDAFIGVGLDSDERDNPPMKFASLFKQAKADGFHITMHCDIDQVDSIEHIRDVLMNIGVERIDHGTNIVEDEKLVAYAKEHQIGFTCCPVSNSFVTEDMKGKEIVELLHKGLKVTVNSDDPAYFQSYISDDLNTLAKQYRLTKADVVQLVKNSFEIAWMPQSNKDAYLQQVDAYVNGFEAE